MTYHIDRCMASGKGKHKRDGAVVLPFGMPRPVALALIRDLFARDQYMLIPKAEENVAEREFTMTQVMAAIEEGEINEGPWKDEHGDWRCRIKKRCAGRLVRVVVAIHDGSSLRHISPLEVKIMSNFYHYSESGLDNVYLANGFERLPSPYGEGIRVQNRKGLHQAIALMLVEEVRELNGKEFRFLRHEINMTQRSLGELLQVGEQTVARWEKGQTKVDGPSQAVIRALYLESIGKGPLKEALARLAELDEALCHDDRMEFEDTDDGWQLAA